jgi:hypothetical protein
VFVVAEIEVAVALGQQSLLDQPLCRGAHHVGKVLFKEFLAVGKVQLRMTVIEDF